ncbi:MAG: CDP-alcohol phosphatidyltransferase family protein, partial [Chloroflexota bacterium]|nr:CDP-alcohol phosphatidyltransferase family protein [Chloroflexota bacterium]
MLSEWLRGHTRGLVDSAALVLHKLGFTPNSLTLMGTAFMFAIALVLAQGYFVPGAILIALAA